MTNRSNISDVFDLYDKALTQTRKRLDDRVVEGTIELEKFYNDFLKDHVVQYAKHFNDEAFRKEMHMELEGRYHSSELRFWAIDGTCKKLETSDLAIFYGGAYVVKGKIGLHKNPPKLSYHESEPENDSSLVAYLPLSPEDLTMMNPENRFFVDDSEIISSSGLDTSLMLLAEIFMCFRGVSGPDRPHIILWDHSLSSVLANATPNVKELRFSGVQIGGESVWYPDLLVGYSKPWDERLDVPSRKSHRLWERAIAKIYESKSYSIDLEEFARDVRLSIDKVKSQVKIIWESDRYGRSHENGNPPDALVRKTGNTLQLNEEYVNSPQKNERLFQFFCNKLFQDKDPSILIYTFKDENGNQRSRFLSQDEISFLVALGLRLTFEYAWRNGTDLIVVSKDSSSTYFTNHYLGVLREIGRFKFQPRLIPSTDRLTFERIPFIDDDIEGPWSSTEFDAIFMTLRMRRENEFSEPTMQGIRGNVLVQPNIIMKSLAQFYFARNPPTEPVISHVIFVDRLLHPDKKPRTRITIVEGDNNLGTIEPFVQLSNEYINREQELIMYLLSVVTRNVFPEVIGYPDPLHHADRGAKSVLNMVEPMLRSSEWLGRTNPIHRTVRQVREGIK